MHTEINNANKPEDTLLALQRLVVEVYKREQINVLRGLNLESTIKGRNIYNWYGDVNGRLDKKYGGVYIENMNKLEDILFCSDEVAYFTALLFVYRPHINNPLEESSQFLGKDVYPNFQNLYAKRYSMLTDVACQTIYKFWDRVAGIIAAFIPGLLDPKRVFFPTVIDAIPELLQVSSNYVWLKDFRENQYKELNDMRKRIVHYSTSETNYSLRHSSKGFSDRQEMEKLQNERTGFADFCKAQNQIIVDGFEKMLLFLEDVSAQMYPDGY